MMYDNLKPLAELDDWQLEHDRQDIRGRAVMGPGGESLGTVREMLVDRDRERVAALTLSDGRTIPVEQVDIRDDRVFLKGAAGAAGLAATGRTEDRAQAEEHIPIVEEEIRVGKRTVQTGGVRVQTRVVEEPVHEQVRLREEHVDIERRPVSGATLTSAEAEGLLRDRTVEMTESAEEAVVGKQAIVKEELVVRKDSDSHVEEVADTVRRTEVDVEQLSERDRDRR